MGLSASSARLLMNQARQADTEFAGQQINQARLLLSNQVSVLYTQLEELEVPVPKTATDFTRTTYSFVIGTTNCTIEALRPDGQFFTMDVSYTTHGHNMVDGSNVQVTRDDSTEPPTYRAGDYPIRTVQDAFEDGLITQNEYNGYIQAFRNMDPTIADPDVYSAEDIGCMFSMYFPPFAGRSDMTERVFLKTTDLQQMVEPQQYIPTMTYSSNGEYTAYQTYPNVDVIFDSSGNISQVGIEAEDSNGVIRRTYYQVATGNEVDQEAYTSAMNQYEYEKHLYDQRQNEINHKMSIYQREDKQLELKLTRLDNERNALKTEEEAVKKVIQDAIDKGFKTFAG